MDLTYDNGAEVPIPVVTEAEATPQPIASSSTHGRSGSRAIPTISITKPPAPRPVDLPTAQDIDPTLPPESDYDLEAGRSPAVAQQFQDEIRVVNHSTVLPPSAILLREASDNSASALPLSPPPPLDISVATIPGPSSNSTPTARTPSTPIPDIMAEALPIIAAIPIQPSTSIQNQSAAVVQSIDPPTTEIPDLLGSSSGSEEDSDEEEETSEEEEEEVKEVKEVKKEDKKEETEEEEDDDEEEEETSEEEDEDEEDESEEEDETPSSKAEASTPDLLGDSTVVKTHQANNSSVSTIKLVVPRKDAPAA